MLTRVLAWCLLGVNAVVAQQQAELRSPTGPALKDEKPFVLRTEVAEVAVQVTVSDRNGRAVSGLTAEDLQILDNGKPVTTVTQFRPSDEVPLRVALVIDWSDSMQKSFKLEREDARGLLRAVLRPDVDEALVIGFRSKAEITQELTGDLQKLEEGVRPIPGARLTALYDAVVTGCTELRETSSSGRRVLLLLTDGADNYSMAGITEVMETARREGVTIYALTPQQSYGQNSDGRALAMLTGATGGRVLVMSPHPANAFQQIETELRSGYSLYFKPAPDRTGSFHSLQIRARDRNLRVGARTVYYSQPE